MAGKTGARGGETRQVDVPEIGIRVWYRNISLGQMREMHKLPPDEQLDWQLEHWLVAFTFIDGGVSLDTDDLSVEDFVLINEAVGRGIAGKGLLSQ